MLLQTQGYRIGHQKPTTNLRQPATTLNFQTRGSQKDRTEAGFRVQSFNRRGLVCLIAPGEIGPGIGLHDSAKVPEVPSYSEHG